MRTDGITSQQVGEIRPKAVDDVRCLDRVLFSSPEIGRLTRLSRHAQQGVQTPQCSRETRSVAGKNGVMGLALEVADPPTTAGSPRPAVPGTPLSGLTASGNCAAYGHAEIA